MDDSDALSATARMRERAEQAETERDRLRAVVDALPVLVERTVRALRQSVGQDLAADPDTIRDAVAAALAAVRSTGQLDVSPDMGGTFVQADGAINSPLGDADELAAYRAALAGQPLEEPDPPIADATEDPTS